MKFLKSFYAEPIVASIISASTGKYIDVNIRFEEFFGLSRKEVIGKSPLELDIWAKKSHGKKAVKDFLQEGSLGKFSLRVIAAGRKVTDVFAVTEVINFKGEDCCLGRLYDITGQIEASKKIREGEEKFGNLLENAPDLIYEFKIQEKRYSYVSPASEEILGVKPEVFLTEKYGVTTRLILKEDIKRVKEHFKNISTGKGRGKKNFYVEFRVRFGSGDFKWLADNHTIVYDKKGNPVSIIGNISDITFRKNSQEELIKSYELQKGYSNLLTSIQDALPAYIAMLDKNGSIVAVNESWRNFDESNRLISKDCRAGVNYISICKKVECMCSVEAREAARGIRKVLKGTLKEFQIEYPCHKPNELRWFRLIVSPIGKPNVTGAVVMHINTTERKQAELELKNSEEQYKLLFFGNPAPMWIYDFESLKFISVNNAAINHYGYSKKEFLNMTLKDIRPKDEINRFLKHHKNNLIGNRRYETRNAGVWRHLKKNGEIIDVEITRTSVDFEGKKAVLILAQDITGILRNEKALRKKSTDIELLYRAGKELSGTLDAGKMLDNIYRIVKENLHCDSMIISSYSSKEKMIRCLAVWHEDVKQDASKLPPLALTPKGSGIQSEVIITGKARIITDFDKYAQKGKARYYFRKDGTREAKPGKNIKVNNSALMVPMKLEGKVIGVVQVLSCEHNAYTTDDLKMLDALLSQLSASAANAKLYQQAQLEISEKEKAQAELKKKKDEITILYNAERELASSLDADEVYDKIYRIVSEMIPCESMVISSFDITSSKIYCLAAWIKDEKLDNSKFPELPLDKTGKGIQSRVIITGKSLIVEDLDEYARKNSSVTYIYRGNLVKKKLPKGDKINRSALLVPMMLKGNAIGVIQVLSYAKKIYTQGHLQLIEALSAQMTAATANAKLYSQAQTEITERKKAEEALHRKSKETSVLYEAQKELTKTLDLDSVYDNSYKIVSRLMPCSAMIVSSYNNEEKLIKIQSIWVDGKKPSVEEIPAFPLAPLGFGIQSRVIRTGEPLLIDDYRSYLKKAINKFVIPGDTHKKNHTGTYSTALIVPMKFDKKVIGTIQVLSFERNAFKESDLKLLESLTTHITAATVNARLYSLAQTEISEKKKAEKAFRRKSNETSVLYEAQKELTKTLDLNSVYDNSYRIISGLMPCDTMMVSSYDKKDNMIRVLSVWTEGYKPALEELPPIPLAPEGYGIQSNVIHTGESLLILDYKSYFKKSINKYTFTNDKLDENIKNMYSSAMIVPMKIESSVIGTIQVLSFKKDAYTENDLRMLETLTTHITAATANAQLYQQAQNEIKKREKAQNELEKKKDEITRLYKAGRDLVSSLEPEKIYDTLYKHMRKIIPCDSMVISNYSEIDNLIRCSSAWIENTKHAASKFPPIKPLKHGKGTQGEVIRTGKSMIINNFDEVTEKKNKKYYFDKEGNVIDFEKNREDIDNSQPITRSALFVPMKLKGKVIGVITAFSFDANAYNNEHLRLLETLSAQVTSVTLNSMLYQQAQSEIMERAKAEAQLRQRTDEITLLYEAYKDLTSTLDTKVIYSKVYGVIRKIMPCDAMSIISIEKISGDMKFVSLWQDDICHDTIMIPMMKYNPENKGILTKLIKTGEPKIYNNYYDVVQKSPGMFAVDNKGEISKQLSEDEDVPVTRSAILVPMKIENSIIGAITVYSYEKEAYKEENLKILEALTTVLSAATLNAMLYQQAQKEIEERIRNEEELTSIKKNLEEAQRIAHIGSWFFDKESNMMTNSDEVYKILGIKPKQEGFEFDQAMNFVHDDDRKQTMKNIKDAIINKKSYVNEDRIIRPDGEVRYVKLMGEPAFDDKGNYKGIHGTMQDITEIKLINAELMRSLNEKEMMLKEIHHRVKNNLQIVSSLLRLQSDKITDSTAIDYLKQSEQRVKSMALIHQQLYRTKDLSKIDFREYLKELCSYLIFAYGVSSQKISLQIEADEVYFGIDTALPCGLIVNELLTNSIKHAFPGNRTGNITIKLYKDDLNINYLTVMDDGIGGKLDFKNADTLGLELVSTLTEQLDGEITSNCNEGTEITISFADQKNKSTN